MTGVATADHRVATDDKRSAQGQRKATTRRLIKKEGGRASDDSTSKNTKSYFKKSLQPTTIVASDDSTSKNSKSDFKKCGRRPPPEDKS